MIIYSMAFYIRFILWYIDFCICICFGGGWGIWFRGLLFFKVLWVVKKSNSIYHLSDVEGAFGCDDYSWD